MSLKINLNNKVILRLVIFMEKIIKPSDFETNLKGMLDYFDAVIRILV